MDGSPGVAGVSGVDGGFGLEEGCDAGGELRLEREP